MESDLVADDEREGLSRALPGLGPGERLAGRHASVTPARLLSVRVHIR